MRLKFPLEIISIHAPREGGDDFKGGLLKKVCNFNPRPPRGGRQGWETRWKDEQKFQSTPPARGATGHAALGKILGYISIHAPREGGRLYNILQVWEG